MTALHSLWLPILVSSVFVFVASSAIHMFLPWHKNDYRTVPDQDKVMDALRPFGIPPGDYMLPRCSSMQEMRSPEYLDKLKRGPVAILTVMPNGMMSMARSMTLWFVYLVAVAAFAAYVAGDDLGRAMLQATSENMRGRVVENAEIRDIAGRAPRP